MPKLLVSLLILNLLKLAISADFCDENPCLNGGTCITKNDTSNDYFCICNPSYSGKDCQFIISLRDASHLNNEKQAIFTTTFNTNSFADSLKQNKVFIVKSSTKILRKKTICDYANPCLNEGTCITKNDTSNDYFCICNPSYSGKDCQFIISLRDASHLNNEKQSILTTNFITGSSKLIDFSSKATPVRSKTICDLVNPCLNDGLCSPIIKTGDYTCICKPGFSGRVCEYVKSNLKDDSFSATNTPETLKSTGKSKMNNSICDLVSPCLNEGICSPINGTDDYTCICKSNYSGRVCEFRELFKNNRTFSATSIFYTKATFSTTTKNLITSIPKNNITICDRVNPCLNEGVCSPVEETDDYTCICKSRYSGRVCEFRTSFIDNNTTYSMTVSKTTISITNPIKKASTICDLVNPCLNEGTCSPIDGTDDYTCNCKKGNTGRLCEFVNPITKETTNSFITTIFSSHDSSHISSTQIINLSTQIGKKNNICDLVNPCLNEGICSPIDGTDDYTCICKSNYSGRVCEFRELFKNNNTINSTTPKISTASSIIITNIATIKQPPSISTKEYTGLSYCNVTSCKNGLCLPKKNGHICLCLKGWEGADCDNKKQNECETSCKNNGICLKGKCKCIPLYKGIDCTVINEEIVNRCSSNICHNGGTCYELGKNQLKCLCKSGFYGQYCEDVN